MPESLNSLSWRDFFARLILFEEPAWRKFVQDYHRLISGVVFHKLGVVEEVDDVVQMIYVELTSDNARLLREFEGNSEEDFVPYLAQIAKFLTNNYRRHRNRNHGREVPSLGLEQVPDERKSLDLAILESWEFQTVSLQLRSLEPEFRQIWELRTQGYLYREIATILGIPLGTVLTRVKKSKKILHSQKKGK